MEYDIFTTILHKIHLIVLTLGTKGIREAVKTIVFLLNTTFLYDDNEDMTMRKLLVISIILLSFGLAQNDGLVKTYYPNGALETEGNYSNGVRDGLWVFWYEGEVFQDFGEDAEPNTNDPGENNGLWDSTETVILDLDGDTFYDPPLKKSEGSY